MGVPGFFKWLWKNYKKTNFVFNKGELDKEIDKQLINLLTIKTHESSSFCKKNVRQMSCD